MSLFTAGLFSALLVLLISFVVVCVCPFSYCFFIPLLFTLHFNSVSLSHVLILSHVLTISHVLILSHVLIISHVLCLKSWHSFLSFIFIFIYLFISFSISFFFPTFFLSSSSFVCLCACLLCTNLFASLLFLLSFFLSFFLVNSILPLPTKSYLSLFLSFLLSLSFLSFYLLVFLMYLWIVYLLIYVFILFDLPIWTVSTLDDSQIPRNDPQRFSRVTILCQGPRGAHVGETDCPWELLSSFCLV